MEQTELEMVNILLGSIEESPVEVVDKAHPDVSLALDKWEEYNTDFQLRSWWFNEEDYVLLRDTITNEVYVPGGTLAIDLSATDVVQRGRRLYDKTNQTYVFTADTWPDETTVVCTMDLEMTDLPPAAHRAILAQAKLAIMTDRNMEPQKLQVAGKDAQMAEFYCKRQQLKYKDPNRLSVNKAQAMLGITPSIG